MSELSLSRWELQLYLYFFFKQHLNSCCNTHIRTSDMSWSYSSIPVSRSDKNCNCVFLWWHKLSLPIRWLSGNGCHLRFFVADVDRVGMMFFSLSDRIFCTVISAHNWGFYILKGIFFLREKWWRSTFELFYILNSSKGNECSPLWNPRDSTYQWDECIEPSVSFQTPFQIMVAVKRTIQLQSGAEDQACMWMPFPLSF